MGVIRTLRSIIRFRRFEWNATRRRLGRAASIEDLRSIARRTLPRGVFDYIDGGAEAETTLASNTQAFRDIEFRPRVLTGVGDVGISTELLGKSLAFPLVLAPTGFTRIANSSGELAVARAAGRAGIPYVLSSLATHSIEHVREVTDGDLWFQVYVWADRGLVAEMLGRALAAGYSAIVITVDTAVLGLRERDVRRGFTLPPKIGIDTLVDGILHPRWTLDFIRHEPIRFSNVVGRSVGDGSSAISLADFFVKQFDPSLSWADIEWFRSRWDRKIILKGIQTVSDSLIAADHGVDAIALSNHGGRQLDGAPPAIELVGPVTDSVGDRLAVLCDGGVRRGSDIVKAIALGAKACMAGRAYLYGLGAGGELGVDCAIGMLREGVRRTLALTGCRSIADVHRDLIHQRS